MRRPLEHLPTSNHLAAHIVLMKANPNKWAEAAKLQEQGTTLLCPLEKSGTALGTIPGNGDRVQPWNGSVSPLPIVCQHSPHRQDWLRIPPKGHTLPGVVVGEWPGAPLGPQQGLGMVKETHPNLEMQHIFPKLSHQQVPGKGLNTILEVFLQVLRREHSFAPFP